eukprot:scaffold57173_cov67-Phaeocystis_antarctica.AAC.1
MARFLERYPSTGDNGVAYLQPCRVHEVTWAAVRAAYLRLERSTKRQPKLLNETGRNGLRLLLVQHSRVFGLHQRLLLVNCQVLGNGEACHRKRGDNWRQVLHEGGFASAERPLFEGLEQLLNPSGWGIRIADAP